MTDSFLILVCFEVELGLHYITVHHIQINTGTDEFFCTAGCPEESFLIFNIYDGFWNAHKFYVVLKSHKASRRFQKCPATETRWSFDSRKKWSASENLEKYS